MQALPLNTPRLRPSQARCSHARPASLARPAAHTQPARQARCSSSSGELEPALPSPIQQQPALAELPRDGQADPAVSRALSSSVAGPVLLGLRQQLQRAAAWVKRHRLGELVTGRQGGLSPALAALAAVPVLPDGGFSDLFTNRVFLAGFWGWFTAQTLKIFTKRLKKGVWDLKAIVDSGGMPSSHSALCAGITTAIAYQNGLGSSAFALAVAFSSVVMYDAAGVRRHAGKQAEVLNQVIGELLEGHPVSETKLKEVLGHTPLQVCAGAVLGVLFGIFFPCPQQHAAAAVAQSLAAA